MAKITRNYDALRPFVELCDGALVWKARPGRLRFNARYAGKEVRGKVNAQGYRVLTFSKDGYQYHIVLWMLHFGKMPANELDHINGKRSDNRIKNLREVTRSLNCRNMALRTDNTSGAVGVCRKRQRWAASICVNGKRRWLGAYSSLELAIAARKACQSDLGFTDRHGARQ